LTFVIPIHIKSLQNGRRLKNSAINGGVLLGKEYIFYIARLDPPLKGREFGEHPIKKPQSFN